MIGSVKSRDEILCKFLSRLIFPYSFCLVLFLLFQQFPLPHSASSSASSKKMVQRSTSFDFLFLWSMCPSSFILNSKTYSVPTGLTESTCFKSYTFFEDHCVPCFHAHSSKCAATGLLLKLCFPGRIKGNYETASEAGRRK